MKINKRFLHFKTLSAFEEALSLDLVRNDSIAFIADKELIWTHGEYYADNKVDPECLQVEIDASLNSPEDVANIKVVAKNTSLENLCTCYTLVDETTGQNTEETEIILSPNSSKTIAQCSLYDIIKLVIYMKSNEQGPWAVGL